MKKLSYTWSYENIPCETLVSFDLNALEQNKTSISLTHEGVENFPSDNPDFAWGNFIEGWNYLIKTSLKNFVEGTKIE
jgi:hypothetical protein